MRSIEISNISQHIRVIAIKYICLGGKNMDYADKFRDAVRDYIKSWDPDNLDVRTEVNVGYRFISTARRIDVVVFNRETRRSMAIECKLQLTNGTNYQKFSYALEDCETSPIPTLLVFASGVDTTQEGHKECIQDDMKSKLVSSGLGIELFYCVDINNIGDIANPNFKLYDPCSLFKQRCHMILGMPWLEFATNEDLLKVLKSIEQVDGNNISINDLKAITAIIIGESGKVDDKKKALKAYDALLARSGTNQVLKNTIFSRRPDQAGEEQHDLYNRIRLYSQYLFLERSVIDDDVANDYNREFITELPVDDIEVGAMNNENVIEEVNEQINNQDDDLDE